MIGVIFQNCGNGFEAIKEDVSPSYLNTQSIGDGVLYSTNLIVDLNQTQYIVSLNTVENNSSEFRLNIQSIVRGQQIGDFQSSVFVDYTDHPPLSAHKSMDRSDEKYLYFLSNDGFSIMMLQVGDGEITFHWELDLPQAINYNEFLVQTNSDVINLQYYMTAKNYIIHDSLSQNPFIEICELTNYELQANRCVGKIQICNIPNGTGQSQFDGTVYSNCRVTGCNMGYHISGNQCALDVISCPIANGTGTQTWRRGSNSYGTCMVNTCNQGYHEFNNVCEADVITCPVANGTGTQTWDPETMAYGTCSPMNCNSGYQLAGAQGNRRCDEILDGSRVAYVNAPASLTNAELRDICNSLPGTMNPVGCIAGEARDANNGGIVFRHGVWGGPSQPGNTVTGTSGNRFCYKPGQKRDNDGTDIIVGMKCANVPSSRVTIP